MHACLKIPYVDEDRTDSETPMEEEETTSAGIPRQSILPSGKGGVQASDGLNIAINLSPLVSPQKSSAARLDPLQPRTYPHIEGGGRTTTPSSNSHCDCNSCLGTPPCVDDSPPSQQTNSQPRNQAVGICHHQCTPLNTACIDAQHGSATSDGARLIFEG